MKVPAPSQVLTSRPLVQRRGTPSRWLTRLLAVALCCLGLTLVGCERSPAPLAEPKTVVLRIEGMKCEENCATRVRLCLEEVPGVAAVDMDFPNKTARLTLDKDLADATLVAAVPDPFTCTVDAAAPSSN